MFLYKTSYIAIGEVYVVRPWEDAKAKRRPCMRNKNFVQMEFENWMRSQGKDVKWTAAAPYDFIVDGVPYVVRREILSRLKITEDVYNRLPANVKVAAKTEKGWKVTDLHDPMVMVDHTKKFIRVGVDDRTYSAWRVYLASYRSSDDALRSLLELAGVLKKEVRYY